MTNVNQIYNFLPSSPSKTGNSISRARIRERKDSSGEQREKKKTCLKKNAARVNKRGSTAPSRSSSRAFLQIHPVSTEGTRFHRGSEQHLSKEATYRATVPRLSIGSSFTSATNHPRKSSSFLLLLLLELARVRETILLDNRARSSARLLPIASTISPTWLGSVRAIARPARDLSRRARASRGMPLMPWTVSKWQPTQFELT